MRVFIQRGERRGGGEDGGTHTERVRGRLKTVRVFIQRWRARVGLGEGVHSLLSSVLQDVWVLIQSRGGRATR